MAEHETAIHIWRDTLTPRQRDSWNSPTSICNRCPAVRAAIAARQASKPPRKPRKSNKTLLLERSLDVVLDCLHEMDLDNRRAAIERIQVSLRSFEEQAAVDETPREVDEKKKPAKRPKAKLKPEAEGETVEAAKGALVWQHVSNSNPMEAHWRAPYADGLDYRAEPANAQGNKITWYIPKMDLPPDHPSGWKVATIGKKVRTLEQAKAICQADFDKGARS
jgi:hypothetical protein